MTVALGIGCVEAPIKGAVNSANPPGAVAAYTLRHSVITDLIRVRLHALMVAQLSGTSVAMIERHYGHLVVMTRNRFRSVSAIVTSFPPLAD